MAPVSVLCKSISKRIWREPPRLLASVSVQPFHREGCIIKKTHCNTSPLLQLPGSKMPPPGPPTRLEEVPEPDALLRAYQAALAGDATIPPVEPLRALLFDAAEKGAPLSSLSLRGVPVGRHGARALANVLYLDSFITFANLEDCSLGDDGAIAVAESLRTHPTLFRLDLGYNGVSGKGVKAIAQLLLESPRSSASICRATISTRGSTWWRPRRSPTSRRSARRSRRRGASCSSCTSTTRMSR